MYRKKKKTAWVAVSEFEAAALKTIDYCAGTPKKN